MKPFFYWMLYFLHSKMLKTVLRSFLLLVFIIWACSSDKNTSDENPSETNTIPFYRGADLSYVNEMEDCGAVYFDANDVEKDPFVIFNEAGTNLVRVRLWHNPTWTNYSNFDDVKTTIQRAKELGMDVLLDFH